MRDGILISDLWYGIFVNCNWVDTRWQQYSTHLHPNNTQNNTIKQNTQNGTYITVRIHKHNNKNTIIIIIIITAITNCGPGSSVGIATDYGLDGPGSNPGRDEIFRPSRPALGLTQPPVKWVPVSFPDVKCGRGVLLTAHPLLVPQSWKSRAIPLPTLWGTPGL